MEEVKKQIKYEFANNCFDLLRLYSAFYVMTLHIMRHVRLQEVSHIFDWWNGVVVLFCISGFLVPASMERSKSVWEFLKKRVLRIIPSMWVCIIIGIIVAALFCGFTLNKTFATWFLGQLVFIRDLSQPEFISNFGIGNFQANLWTMIFTVQFYIITAIIYRFMKNRRIWVWIFALTLSMALNLAVPYLQEILPETGKIIVSHSCLPYFYIYFAGWFMYRYREKIVPVLARTKILCIALFIIRALYCDKVGARVGEYQDMIQVLLLCMLTIGIGYSFGKIRFKFDLSYGLYLYHMVIVDIFVQVGLVGSMKYVIAVYAIAVLCALASHFLVDDTVAKIFKKTESTKYNEIEKTEVSPLAPDPVREKVPAVQGADDEESDF
ncbi:MAG: acyltransferase family protein [Hominilimicola sp.]